MTRSIKSAALVAAFLAAPLQAADPLSNSYWDAAYIHSDVDGSVTGPSLNLSGSDTEEGFRLGLGIGFSQNVSFVGDYDQRRDGGIRTGYGSAGFSLHTGDREFQPFVAATYERFEFDDNSDPTRDDVEEGWGAEGGLRVALTDLELGASYKYIDYGEAGPGIDRTATRYGVLAGLQLSPKWALTAQYRVLTDKAEGGGFEAEVEYTDYTIGLRRYFATDADRLKRKGGLLGGPDE